MSLRKARNLHLSSREEDEVPFLLVENYVDREEADDLLHHCLTNLPWQVERIDMFGRSHIAPRLSCSMGDSGLKYQYRGAQGKTFPFTTTLREIRANLVHDWDVPFNFVLANRYRDGSDYVGWHSDDERDLVNRGMIASLSLGATRTLRLRNNKTREVQSICLKHGSLLLMYGCCQENFKHTLTKTARLVTERVNLSYRCVVN